MLTFVPHKVNENYNKVGFYRVNKELCNNEVYKNLSPTAILLYSLLCDRLSLSYTNALNNKTLKAKNQYYDEQGNVYVIFTRIDLEEKIHVGKSAIASAFEQLKIVNLIQEKRQGKNKPKRIYVGKTISEVKEDFINWKSEYQTSGDTNLKPLEVRKSDVNKNNILNLKSKNKSYLNYESRDYSDMGWDKLYVNYNWE